MEETKLRLTKKVADCSELSRREASEVIKKGEITINGKVEKNPAAEVRPGDVIARNGKELVKKEKEEYFLFNKPKDMFFSEKSPKNRPSVLDIMAKTSKATLHSVHPVPDTACGLLLLTNDETLVYSFQHQLRSVKQKYKVVLVGIPDTELLTQLENKWKENKALGLTHCKMESNKDGIILEIEMNGYGIEQIQSDLSEHSFPIVKIDRISLGNMTKKDISRGWYRPLTEKEIIWLKHFH